MGNYFQKYFVLVVVLLSAVASCGKLKFVAFKGPHFGFAGIKVKVPKLFRFKHHHGLGQGGFGGAGFHSSSYEHHQYHESHHHSGGSFGGGGWFGK